MPGPAAVLREIHRLRRFARDLQSEIDRGPRVLKNQQAKVSKQEGLLQEWHDSIKKVKVAMHEKEVSLRTRHQQIAKHEKQRNEATSKKEYDALQAEIDSDRRGCQKLEDDILEDMAEIEDRTNKIPELEQNIKRAKDELAEFEKGYQERQENLAQQFSQTEVQLREVEASLPADIRQQYDRLVAAKGEEAMAAVEIRTCSACYTEITAQNYNELIVGLFVFCKNCGRMLYLPGNPTTDGTDGRG
jgi:predicted  nucleic acid-binding Zn-ribbon protein